MLAIVLTRSSSGPATTSGATEVTGGATRPEAGAGGSAYQLGQAVQGGRVEAPALPVELDVDVLARGEHDEAAGLEVGQQLRLGDDRPAEAGADGLVEVVRGRHPVHHRRRRVTPRAASTSCCSASFSLKTTSGIRAQS